MLSPDGYQYPNLRRDKWNAWDENWLLIAGEVSSEGRHWSFRDPALTASEAMALVPWLHHVAEGTVPVSEPDTDGWVSPDLVFVEPNIAFSVAGRNGNFVLLRVHFSLESAPPEFDPDERAEIWRFFVELSIDPNELVEAAAQWEHELEPFPVRESP